MIDLPSIPDEQLRERAQQKTHGIALLMSLKHVYDRAIRVFFKGTLINLLERIDKEGDSETVTDLLYYLLKQNEFLDEGQFLDDIHNKFSEEVEKAMPTIIQKAEARGSEKRNIEIAERMLSEKSNLKEIDIIEFVHRMTGLSIDRIKELKKRH